MWSSLFFSLFLCETLMHVAEGQEHSDERGDGFIPGNSLLRPSSVWGCEKYSAGLYVVTKRAISFAKEVTSYVQYSATHSENSENVSVTIPITELKLNVIREGINLYRDLVVIVQVMWHDSVNAIAILGKELSNELGQLISRLPSPKV